MICWVIHQKQALQPFRPQPAKTQNNLFLLFATLCSFFFVTLLFFYSTMYQDTSIEDLELEDLELEVCEICGSTPCEWTEYGDSVLQQSRLLFHQESNDGETVLLNFHGEVVPNSTARKALYRAFTHYKFGHLGKGNWIPLTDCVTQKIRELFPEENGKYEGFRNT